MNVSGLQVHEQRRFFQAAAGYEDCNDADFPRIDPATGILDIIETYNGFVGAPRTVGLQAVYNF